MTLEQQGPVRFSVRGMLLAVTAACALLGLLQWLLPKDISVWSRAWTSAIVVGLAAYAVWIYRRSKQPWRPPSELVTVSIDAKWKRRVKSPYIMGPVAALTGVSVTFAPLFLFTRGPISELAAWEWVGVAASFLMIYLVPGFYMRLAAEVMAALLREDDAVGGGGRWERSAGASRLTVVGECRGDIGVIGVHIVVGAYGFWLPNDPRGSWSAFVGSGELFRFGGATKVTTHRSLAGRRHDVAARLAAKQALRRPAVKFDGMQARAIGRGFAACAEKSGLRMWACAILPDHWHLVVGAHRLTSKQMAIQLKGAATRRLVAEGIHPFGSTPEGRRIAKCFARGEWSGVLNTEDEVRRAIRYVEGNPMKEGLRPQRWSFVTDFAGE